MCSVTFWPLKGLTVQIHNSFDSFLFKIQTLTVNELKRNEVPLEGDYHKICKDHFNEDLLIPSFQTFASITSYILNLGMI